MTKDDQFEVHGIEKSIILLFDASGSMNDYIWIKNDDGSTYNARKINDAKYQSKKFIGEVVDENDEVALMVFYNCGDIRVVQGFTKDEAIIASLIDTIYPRSGTPLYDAIDYAERYMTDNARGKRKAIVAFTDGANTC